MKIFKINHVVTKSLNLKVIDELIDKFTKDKLDKNEVIFIHTDEEQLIRFLKETDGDKPCVESNGENMVFLKVFMFIIIIQPFLKTHVK